MDTYKSVGTAKEKSTATFILKIGSVTEFRYSQIVLLVIGLYRIHPGIKSYQPLIGTEP